MMDGYLSVQSGDYANPFKILSISLDLLYLGLSSIKMWVFVILSLQLKDLDPIKST